MMEAALRSHLLADATIAASVGTRVYPLKARQGETTLPRIIYQKVSDVTLITHEGYGGNQTSRVQIKATAATYSDAKTLAKQIQNKANTFRGDFSGTVITDCRPTGTVDLPESAAAGAESGPNTVSQDWLVSWKDD
jgi:hypothetical protein